jgi:hypothetical protein
MRNSRANNTKSRNNKNTNKSFIEVHKEMCKLKEDLYYKDIVNAHKDIITKGTNKQVEDIMYRFNKRYISKHEMFTELENLKSGYKVTDIIVKDALNFARKTFCKKPVKSFNKNTRKRK